MPVKSPVIEYRFAEFIGSEMLESIRSVWEGWQDHPNADFDFFSAVANSRLSVIHPLAIVIYNNATPLALAACRLEKVELPITLGYINVASFTIRQLTVVYGGLMGTWNDSIAKAFVSHIQELMQREHIDGVYFAAMPNENPVYKMANRFVPFFLRCIAHKNNLHWYAKLTGSFEEFLQRINKKHRKQLRQKERKLVDYTGGILQMKTFQAPTDVEEFCSIAEKIAQLTYLRGIGAGFQNSVEMQKQLNIAAQKGWMRGHVLYANNRPCAFWLGTLYNRAFHLDYTGFDPELKNFDPGQVLFNKMIEALCATGTTESIDFGFGDALYKRFYGDLNFTESDFFIFNNTPTMVLVNMVTKLTAFVNYIAEKVLKKFDLYLRIKKLFRRSAEKSIQKIDQEPDRCEKIQKRKPIRVCMVAYAFYECDNRIRRYAEALVKRGDSVDVIALGRPGYPRKTVISGVSVFRIQTRKIDEKRNIDYLFKIILFLLHSFGALTWRHILHPYQLIHVHSVPDFEVFAAVATKLTGAKVILDIHDIVPEFYAAKFSSGKDSFMSKVLVQIEKICCAFSDHVIISNHIWKEKLVTRSIQQKKCSVFLNYPDPAIFKKHYNHTSREIFSLCYPGTHVHHQGVDIAIRALALVNEAKVPFHFDIYGTGPDEALLKTMVLSLGLNDSITFHGVFSLDEIAAIMAKADLGIVPKRADGFGNEAFSTKIFEFMSLHVPVLISSTKIDRYYFNDSVVMFFESGNVNQLADKIIFLAQNKQVRETLAANSSEFIKQYNWDLKKNEYFQLVDSLTKNEGR